MCRQVRGTDVFVDKRQGRLIPIVSEDKIRMYAFAHDRKSQRLINRVVLHMYIQFRRKEGKELGCRIVYSIEEVLVLRRNILRLFLCHA